jgi:putative transposase
MARASRHYSPGLIWHVTHRCHKREFLLKFEKDKLAWWRWMVEAKERYDLCVLDYCITSNHVHVSALERLEGERGAISRSLQLAAGRVAQEYNERKSRSGAFWEDRYHATAVETGGHLVACLTYIDLNMVRAGVVGHPSEWPYGAFYELVKPRSRFRNQLVDWTALMDILGMKSIEHLREAREAWVREALKGNLLAREPKWTEALAVGSKPFVEEVAEKIGGRAAGREITGLGESYVLHEEAGPYHALLEGGKRDLRQKKG